VSGRLSGKVCVVTGTGGTIGRAMAFTFAREGASVFGSDVSVTGADILVDGGMKVW
jgi:NAD(P)-dependent dehydrogenase (short-subunit alcohol dehydrogenase family)